MISTHRLLVAERKRAKAREKYIRLIAEAETARASYAALCVLVTALGGDPQPGIVCSLLPQAAAVDVVTAVARDLDLPRKHVQRVADGKGQSKRVEAALRARYESALTFIRRGNGSATKTQEEVEYKPEREA